MLVWIHPKYIQSIIKLWGKNVHTRKMTSMWWYVQGRGLARGLSRCCPRGASHAWCMLDNPEDVSLELELHWGLGRQSDGSWSLRICASRPKAVTSGLGERRCIPEAQGTGTRCASVVGFFCTLHSLLQPRGASRPAGGSEETSAPLTPKQAERASPTHGGEVRTGVVSHRARPWEDKRLPGHEHTLESPGCGTASHKQAERKRVSFREAVKPTGVRWGASYAGPSFPTQVEIMARRGEKLRRLYDF